MSTSRSKKPRVFVIVHDAGGAEVIGAYIRAHRKDAQFVAYGAGPSVLVFKRLRLPLRPIKDSISSITKVVRHNHDVAYALIAAPGWMTKIEINALEITKKAGLKTVVYMDSWTDERKRFGFSHAGWQKRLPDIFWAGDKYAYANLARQFPHIPVRLVPNQYFRDEIARYKALKRTTKPDSILFTSTIGGDSHELLSKLLRVLSNERHRAHLRIRYHPADKRNRYYGLLQSFKGSVHAERSRERDLVKDLARTRLVVGTETMAMAIAVLCKVPTVSFIKDGAQPTLPFPGVLRFRSMKSLIKKEISGA